MSSGSGWGRGRDRLRPSLDFTFGKDARVRFVVGYPIVHLDPAAEILTQEAVSTIAAATEANGFDALAFTEHPAPPAAWRDENGHDALDPFVALAFAAAATRRIRLLTYLAVVPYHRPFALAKTSATLDRLSDGRLVLGIGTGYLKGEFQALGVRFEDRNQLFEESMEVLQLAWTGQPVDYHGPSCHAVGTVSRPTPRSTPRPPIWIGGNSALVRRRVAQYGDGWMPIPTTAPQQVRRMTARLESIDRLGAQIRELQQDRERLGRIGPAQIMFTVKDIDPRVETDRYLERIHQLAGIGVDWLSLEPPRGPVEAIVEYLHWFDSEVRPHTPPAAPAPVPDNVDPDRIEIIDLYRTYARALDRRQFELLREVFGSDALCDFGHEQVHGIDAVIDHMVAAHRDFADTRHIPIDFDLTIDGNTATARVAKRNRLIPRIGDPTVHTGQYVDALVRAESGWRIVRRTSR